MLKSELESKSYRELQDMAKNAGMAFVGVSKDELAEKLKEPEQQEEVEQDEEFVDPVVMEMLPPKLATTDNFGKDEFKPVIESIPVVTYRTKMVKIKPRKNIPKSIIGQNVWELKVGKIYEVPEEVAQIFENGGYL